jgi:hypothetical protein
VSEDPGPWRVRDGVLIIEQESSAAHRVFRPVLRAAGLGPVEPMAFPIESVTNDELVYRGYYGSRVVLTRVSD